MPVIRLTSPWPRTKKFPQNIELTVKIVPFTLRRNVRDRVVRVNMAPTNPKPGKLRVPSEAISSSLSAHAFFS